MDAPIRILTTKSTVSNRLGCWKAGAARMQRVSAVAMAWRLTISSKKQKINWILGYLGSERSSRGMKNL